MVSKFDSSTVQLQLPEKICGIAVKSDANVNIGTTLILIAF